MARSYRRGGWMNKNELAFSRAMETPAQQLMRENRQRAKRQPVAPAKPEAQKEEPADGSHDRRE